MRSATGRTKAASGGFTLLEICIVLCILSVVLGASLPQVSSWLAEEKLRGPARQLELLARTARAAAMERQRPVDVVILPNALALTEADAAPGAGDLVGSYPLSEEAVVMTRPWGAPALASRKETRWRFQPDGLCEPMEISFSRGASRISLTFDPLTAAVAEEKYAFQ
jgi:Tfp pilus assembly protein FimT